MKAKKNFYEKLINTGNFSHEKFGIEIELDKNEKADDAIKQAKRLIERQLSGPSENERDIAQKVAEFDDDEIPF